jgi:hypothetical protein
VNAVHTAELRRRVAGVGAQLEVDADPRVALDQLRQAHVELGQLVEWLADRLTVETLTEVQEDLEREDTQEVPEASGAELEPSSSPTPKRSRLRIGDQVLVTDLDVLAEVEERVSRDTWRVTVTSAYGDPGRSIVRHRDQLVLS